MRVAPIFGGKINVLRRYDYIHELRPPEVSLGPNGIDATAQFSR